MQHSTFAHAQITCPKLGSGYRLVGTSCALFNGLVLTRLRLEVSCSTILCSKNCHAPGLPRMGPACLLHDAPCDGSLNILRTASCSRTPAHQASPSSPWCSGGPPRWVHVRFK